MEPEGPESEKEPVVRRAVSLSGTACPYYSPQLLTDASAINAASERYATAAIYQ